MLSFLKSNSILGYQTPPPIPAFKGSIEEYIAQHGNFPGIYRVELSADNKNNAQTRSIMDNEKLAQFMNLVNERGVKELYLGNVALNPASGIILASALMENKKLKTLFIDATDLGKVGVVTLYESLKENKSLKDLYCDGTTLPNKATYYLSEEEIHALGNLITENTALKNIYLIGMHINNQRSHLEVLMKPYNEIDGRNLVNLCGLKYGDNYLGDLNKYNPYVVAAYDDERENTNTNANKR